MTEFTFYDVTLRLRGKNSLQCKRRNVSAPEAEVLMNIHGHDSFISIKPALGGEIYLGGKIAKFERSRLKIDNAVERERLEQIYGTKVVDSVFGTSKRAELPTSVNIAELSVREESEEDLPVKDMDALRAEIRAEVMAELEASHEGDKPRGPGRPKKVQPEAATA